LEVDKIIDREVRHIKDRVLGNEVVVKKYKEDMGISKTDIKFSIEFFEKVLVDRYSIILPKENERLGKGVMVKI